MSGYRTYLNTSAALLALGWGSYAIAADFNIPRGDLKAALDLYTSQTGTPLLYVTKAVAGVKTGGVSGDVNADQALAKILSGTGFVVHRDASGVLAIVRSNSSRNEGMPEIGSLVLAQATPARTAVETVTVTSSKLGGADVQSIPIAITALSQEQLTATQTAGGPDLVKQVPNLTFTKTNFTGYSIQIRGIGTQAISVTTDPAVAVAFNDVPFIRNHFFEQEFFDLSQVEVLRGPQGTLYGRNATAGVVNLVPARATDQFEAMASGEIGNYHQRRFEGMVNLPIVDDRLDIRLAGEWTKRQGYSFNQLTNSRIDGRDLWSGRLTIGLKPVQDLQIDLVWEHFSEDDDRLRSSKQLCKKDPTPNQIAGVPIAPPVGDYQDPAAYLSQGCQMVSLYSPEAFQVPNGYSLPFILGLGPGINAAIDPYASTTQSRNLRVIESTLQPIYRSKNDLIELNADYTVSPQIGVTSQTAFSHDFLYSTQDYNRFNTTPGIWDADYNNSTYHPGLINDQGEFCDPQLGCSSRLVAQDLSNEHAWQLSHEFRIKSSFSGPFNFNAGGNYLHYETEENYYVFINALTLLANSPLTLPPGFNTTPWIPNVTDNMQWLAGTQRPNPFEPQPTLQIGYIDPNPLATINSQGHNYFLSQNPYKLDSYALFGEANYKILDDLTLTAGLRWTDDQKHFVKIPSEVLVKWYGYPTTGAVDQGWSEFTGRSVANWTPKLDFTDQTLMYASYSHGYKAGGANPPGAILTQRPIGTISNPIHPLTFDPEFIDAFELGTKNTLVDGSLTVNASAFYYAYQGYQISEIVDRTAINLNFDAHVKGGEVEATWEPTLGLRFNFAGGWESTALAKGSRSIDLMDRTAGRSDWLVIKPFPTQASNCVLPDYVVLADFQIPSDTYANVSLSCGIAYSEHTDPITYGPYVPYPTTSTSGGPVVPPGYPGFDPLAGTPGDPYTGQNTYNGHDYGPAPNNGVGFYKDLSGNELPNAPPFTVSAGAQYTVPLSSDWAGTLRGDFYWQDNSWARVFNDNPYDRIHGYTNLNLTLILTSQNGWQIMLYDKNVFNTTAITGDFLNSDDSGLTTNVFLTDPKLIGIRVTKNW